MYKSISLYVLSEPKHKEINSMKQKPVPILLGKPPQSLPTWVPVCLSGKLLHELVLVDLSVVEFEQDWLNLRMTQKQWSFWGADKLWTIPVKLFIVIASRLSYGRALGQKLCYQSLLDPCFSLFWLSINFVWLLLPYMQQGTQQTTNGLIIQRFAERHR